MWALLDTHVLLWSIRQSAKLPQAITALLDDPENTILFSAVSIWEVAIKSSLGRKDFGVDAQQLAEAAVRTGFRELPLISATAARVASLPRHHGDPFDHLLVAQAIAQPARLITADRALAPYSELVMTFQPMPT